MVWGSFALLPALFQHVQSILCEATAHLGDEENWWSGGLGVTVASHTCKTFFMELVASTNGNHCIHDLKTGVVVQALLLPDQGLWFQELYGAFMSFPSSQHHHSPLQLQKGSCSCSCGGHVYWERGSKLEAGLLSLGSAGQPGSLLHVSLKPSMG